MFYFVLLDKAQVSSQKSFFVEEKLHTAMCEMGWAQKTASSGIQLQRYIRSILVPSKSRPRFTFSATLCGVYFMGGSCYI